MYPMNGEVMHAVLRWKVLLPAFQTVLAIALWLYAPVQYRKEVLEWSHLPSEHPFRFNFEGVERFPPICEQTLYAINFPAYSLARIIETGVIYPIEYSQRAALPEWEWRFALPVKDPEARPPRKIPYFVHTQDQIFLGLVVLLWWRVGCWVDAYVHRPAETRTPWGRGFRMLDLAVIAATLLCSAAYSYVLIVHIRSAPYLHVGMFGLVWVALLLAYLWFTVKRELRIQGGK
jgi:hypothetical protein